MERVWGVGKFPMRTRRIQACANLVYKFGKFTRLIPFDYKIRQSNPDEIIYLQQSLILKSISVFLATFLTVFIIHWYFVVFFGKVTRIESSIALALNAVLCVMNTAQWVHILDFYRTGGLNLANYILRAQFRARDEPLFAAELLYVISVVAAVNCQIFPYPVLVYTSHHFPGLLSVVDSGADLIAGWVFGSSVICSVLMRHGTYVVISTALCNAFVHQSILAQWLFSFLCTMNQYQKTQLEFLKDYTGKAGTLAQVECDHDRTLDTSSFLETQVLYSTFHAIFGRIFTSYAVNYIVAVIYLMLLLVSPAVVLPMWIKGAVVISSSSFLICALILFKQVTDSHIFMYELIAANRQKCRGESIDWGHEFKFWKSMRPPRSTILGLCSFETRGFLLVIWADVIMMSVINLLLAF